MLKNGPYLIATLLVKNEEDILEHSVNSWIPMHKLLID